MHICTYLAALWGDMVLVVRIAEGLEVLFNVAEPLIPLLLSLGNIVERSDVLLHVL